MSIAFKLKNQTHKETFTKFILLLSTFLAYFGYLSWEYDLKTGGIIAALTWSFFVLCTPIADAGFLLDFPIRMITGIKMITTEIGVWVIAVLVNIATLNLSPESYETTFLTQMFFQILTNPWPYWSIIILCGLGTFLSIYFGDEMLDVIKHKHCQKRHKHRFKHQIIAMAALFLLIILTYYHLIEKLGIAPVLAG